jgi:hypothetical protein
VELIWCCPLWTADPTRLWSTGGVWINDSFSILKYLNSILIRWIDLIFQASKWMGHQLLPAPTTSWPRTASFTPFHVFWCPTKTTTSKWLLWHFLIPYDHVTA